MSSSQTAMHQDIGQQQSLFGAVLQPTQAQSAQETTWDMMKNTLLEAAVFTVIDLETTGLNARKNAITEIAAICFKNGVEISKYTTLVKPTESIPDEVEQITGINNEMVKNAPAAVMALSEMAGAVGATPIIVGHNVSFDIGFLREKLAANGLNAFVDRFDLTKALCTKVLAQKIMPGLPSYQGIVVATSVGVKNPNPHRAENDVRMSGEILFGLIARLKQERPDIQTVGDLLAFQGAL